MCDYYSSSDLVISRAGALTLSELANFNIPSILIPFPHAANNHQMHNAEYFKSNKSAEIVNHYAKMFEGAAMDKDFKAAMHKKGILINYKGPADYKKHFQATYDYWKPIAKQVGVYKRKD